MNIITNCQPGLPFEFEAGNDTFLRADQTRSRLKISFEAAMRIRAPAFCPHFAEKVQMKKQTRHG